MTLFDHQGKIERGKLAPLSTRMRPESFDDFIGQEHIVGPNSVLRKSIDSDQIPSLILWGPPGSGKTTLAYLISDVTKSYFASLSAVSSGVADLRRIASEAKNRLDMYSQRTILFVDEIHRFNKSQQDIVLPYVEDGIFVLIGATTENPSFEVISPLLSRCRVFTLKPLNNSQVKSIVKNAMENDERGLGTHKPNLDDESMDILVKLSNGDARVALNALELASNASPIVDGIKNVTVATLEDAMQKRALIYDKAGDQHYDIISAFIKSLRSSDPDAAIYWLARMIEAGEDPMFIARRLVIFAAEDVGTAEPQALSVAVAAQQALHLVGMPEGRIPLAEATVYLATAFKSNASYMAINKAIEDVRKTGNEQVPLHLRNPVTNLMMEIGYGKNYKYAHNYEGNFSRTQNLPESLKGSRYYKPSDQGFEKEISNRLRNWWDDRVDDESSDG